MSTARTRPPIAIDIVVESRRWTAARTARSTVRKAITAAAAKAPAGAEVAVILTSDAAIRTLNKRWRGKNKPTNVLSFPAMATGGRRLGPRPLGDIVIAYETMAREAKAESKPFSHHLSHLAVHGFLHLLGYDHESDTEAEEMERLERRILARLDVPDPYAPRDAG